MVTKELEMEKRLLLAKLPALKYDGKLFVEQHYARSPVGEVNRVRRIIDTDHNTMRFFHTLKEAYPEMGKTTHVAACLEIEKEVDQQFYVDFVESKSINYLRKVRHILNIGNFMWEIDVFTNPLNLVIAEIELQRVLDEYPTPHQIKDVLLMDISNEQQFSNYNLAKIVSRN